MVGHDLKSWGDFGHGPNTVFWDVGGAWGRKVLEHVDVVFGFEKCRHVFVFEISSGQSITKGEIVPTGFRGGSELRVGRVGGRWGG